jgi:hypothetical protein
MSEQRGYLMYGLCIPLQLGQLLASGSFLTLGIFLLLQLRSRQGEKQMDGNERLMIRFTIFAIFILLIFIFFLFAWRPC